MITNVISEAHDVRAPSSQIDSILQDANAIEASVMHTGARLALYKIHDGRYAVEIKRCSERRLWVDESIANIREQYEWLKFLNSDFGATE
jgi:hypothetical protein|nr:MAG TPA: hypothetical protein [Caudoviricetes sp.]